MAARSSTVPGILNPAPALTEPGTHREPKGASRSRSGPDHLIQSCGSPLHGVGPFDPLSVVAAVCLVAGATALACWIPARRAARIDPVTALRSH
ncbi:MAG: hypothetical protein M3541_08845 [Acidobacteriota bacterium]|nr:hypothetical protein [Acidobacteriota bacterium]